MDTSACDGKRELITLDLLGSGGGSSSVVVGAHAKNTPFRSCHRLLLHPPELDLFPADGASNPTPLPPAAGIQSVCTIEQVKRALERAERDSRGAGRPLPLRRRRRAGEEAGGCASPSSSPSSSSSSSSSSVTTGWNKRPGGVLMAAGCSGCLSYVLISADKPRCPRCGSQVAPPPAQMTKRPRIDLNFKLSN